MTLSQHIATASILSFLTNIPVVGFIIGFLSHIILDILEPQEYKINFTKVNNDKDIIMLEVLLSLALFYYSLGNIVIFLTVIGGILPDLIDGILSIIDRSRYQKGKHLFWFHRSNGEELTMSKRKTMILSIILTIITFIFIY
jgi:hypothetical protein